MKFFTFACLILTSLAYAREVDHVLNATLADGFDFPVGNLDGGGGYTEVSSKRRFKSWRVESSAVDALYLEAHETWSGSGGGSTVANQPVYAMASGRVLEVNEGVVEIEHDFLSNGQPQRVRVAYEGIQASTLKPGEMVKRRQCLAKIAPGSDKSPARLAIMLKHCIYSSSATWPMKVSEFIRTHRRLFVPAREDRVLIAVKHAFELHVCEKGKIAKTLPVALGQDGRNRKILEGDNRTPEGDYRITQKALGPFEGDFGAYLGAAWLRLSYPNSADARLALREGRITQKVHDAIVAADRLGNLAPTGTVLGDGVGIHGWVSDWPDGENLLTWGCLSLRRADLLSVHELVKKGTRVLILP